MTSTLTTTLTTTLTPTVQGKKHKSLRKARLSFDEFDELRDPRPEASDFSAICERRYARRSFLGGAAAVGAAAFVRSVANSTGAVRSALASGHGWLDFKPIQTSTADTITLPQGFSWHRVISWGDPMVEQHSRLQPQHTRKRSQPRTRLWRQLRWYEFFLSGQYTTACRQ